MALERWTNPRLSRRTCTCEFGLQLWRGKSAGAAKRPRELISHPKSEVRFATFASLYAGLPGCACGQPGVDEPSPICARQHNAPVRSAPLVQHECPCIALRARADSQLQQRLRARRVRAGGARHPAAARSAKRLDAPHTRRRSQGAGDAGVERVRLHSSRLLGLCTGDHERLFYHLQLNLDG
jgi:hypothetical protein